jgi:sugar O-acyltransferase (sialic acid O-acetyltransferase NeuD family)
MFTQRPAHRLSPLDHSISLQGFSASLPMVLFGSGSPIVVEYLETCRRLGLDVAGVVCNRPGTVYFDAAVPVFPTTDATLSRGNHACICPLFTPANRAQAVAEAAALGWCFTRPLIDPTATVASNTTVAAGSYINAGCVLGAVSRIGRHVVINRASSIGHHAEIADFASIGPGVTVGGQVAIEQGATVGAGAIVLPGIRIGAFALVAAGSVVSRDVAPRCKSAGNPARMIDRDLSDFPIPGA